MNTSKIQQQIEHMTIEELRTHLMHYMQNDPQLCAPIVAIEVRLSPSGSAKCRYSVLLIDEEGGETEVQFRDRCSRLVYIYTLLHPQGYQRRQAAAYNYRELCHLYSMLYFRGSDALLKTIESTDTKKPGHFFSHYIAQSRNAVRQASPLAEAFAIDRPQSHNGKVLIPFVANGGNVIIDASLRNQMSHL